MNTAVSSEPRIVALEVTADAIVAQLATFHSPDDVWIVLCLSDERRADWEWTKWLPHSIHPHETDGAGPTRMTFSALGELEDMLGAEFQEVGNAAALAGAAATTEAHRELARFAYRAGGPRGQGGSPRAGTGALLHA